MKHLRCKNANKKIAKKIRHKIIDIKNSKIDELTQKVGDLLNENRKLKRRVKSNELVSSNTLVEVSDPTNKDTDKSSILLESVSPRGKKRALQRLKLITSRPSPIKSILRLEGMFLH